MTRCSTPEFKFFNGEIGNDSMNEKKYELRKQIRNVRWMIFWVVLAQFAAQIAVDAIVSFMKNPPHEYILIALVELLAIGVPIMVYARSVWSSDGQDVKREFGLNPCKPYLLLLAAALGVCGQFVMILLNVPTIYLETLLGRQTEEAIPVALNGAEVFWGFFAVVLIPSVLEEFWMRGIIFSAYNKSNTVAAIFFTSLIFALLHMRLNEVLGFLFMGIVASVVMLKCNSLYAAMVYHGFSNLTALLLSGFILPYIANCLWAVFAAAIIGFVGFFVLLLTRKNRVPLNKNFRADGLVMTSLFSMPVLFSIVVVVVKYLIINIG